MKTYRLNLHAILSIQAESAEEAKAAAEEWVRLWSTDTSPAVTGPILEDVSLELED